ncbi:MAG: hypothetical protein Fur0037_06740 [Planctomycetota bacterium]
MRKLLVPAILALAGLVQAQCGTLAVNGPGTPGTTLDIALTGATPNGFAILFAGPTTGATPIHLGLSTLTIGLEAPFLAAPMGPTDANGDASLSVPIPQVTIPQQITLHAQAATISFSMRPFSISGCTSNVATFTIG